MRTLPDTTSKQGTRQNTAASSTDSVITLPAASDTIHVLDWIVWSYSGDPTAGKLTVLDNTNANTLMEIDITKGGPGGLFFSERGIQAPKAAELIITLADGAVTSKLNIQVR